MLGPQGVTVADFPSANELDAANGIVHEDAAIEINRKLVVDSLKASALLKVPSAMASIPRAISAAFDQHRLCWILLEPVVWCARINCVVAVAKPEVHVLKLVDILAWQA